MMGLPRGVMSALVLAALTGAASARAATLPAHEALRLLIISDGVNPHGLDSASLTEPGDLLAALDQPANGLLLSGETDDVVEVASDCIDDALTALAQPFGSGGAYDVVIYFAHRGAESCAGDDRQPELTAAVDAFLAAGGGLVVFHHGIFFDAAKSEMLTLIGGSASSIAWNTMQGQNVIDVAPGHFVTTNGVTYTGSVAYDDVANGVAAGNYELFNNTPDERYRTLTLDPAAETITMLFASDYDQNGTRHVLGFVHEKASWLGRVVVYQPGEYQPNALDDLDGPNFQVLANAIVFAAGALLEAPLLSDDFESANTAAWSAVESP